MDSRSGSLQSSSGGDDEYVSRAAVAFMNSGRVSEQQFFEPLEDYLNQNKILKNSSMMMPVFSGYGPATATGVDIIESCPVEEPAAARNSKKRSRASRRAPTTVLTTDTTNFRAMVQEFTGIPSLSFSNSPFTRRRLDLFSARPGSSETTKTTAASQYFRFPFADTVQFPPTRISDNGITSVSSTNFNQNPQFSSPIQSNPRFIFSIPPIQNSKSNLVSLEIPSISQPKTCFFEEQFSIHENHTSETPTGRQTLIFSDQIPLQNKQNDNQFIHHGDKDITFPDNTRSLSINGSEEYAFFLNNRASTSSFQTGKEPENTAGCSRDSTFGSWICSSQWK